MAHGQGAFHATGGIDTGPIFGATRSVFWAGTRSMFGDPARLLLWLAVVYGVRLGTGTHCVYAGVACL